MARTARSIVQRAQEILVDLTEVRWEADELLMYVNDGIKAVAVKGPDAYIKTEVQVVAADTKQAVPTDGVRFIEVIRNFNADGTAPTTAVRRGDMSFLDATNPDWHTETANAAELYFYSPKSPKEFYIYPRPTQSRLEVRYAAIPGDITMDGEIPIGDIYVNAVLNYTLFRAFSKDGESTSADKDRAAFYFQAFEQDLLTKERADLTVELRDGRD